MAFLAPLQNSHPFLNPPASSFASLSLQPQIHLHLFYKASRFRPCCSQNTTQVDTKQPQRIKIDFESQKKKRKPRPSFYEQIREKWSLKPLSQSQQFPWQQQEQEQEEPPPSQVEASLEMESNEEREQGSGVSVSSNSESPRLFAQLIDGSRIGEPVFHSETYVGQTSGNLVHRPVSSVSDDEFVPQLIDGTKNGEPVFDSVRDVDPRSSNLVSDPVGSASNNDLVSSSASKEIKPMKTHSKFQPKNDLDCSGDHDNVPKFGGNVNVEEVALVTMQADKVMTSKYDVHKSNSWNGELKKCETEREESSAEEKGANHLPWMREAEQERRRRSKTELAEKLVPEHELKRLRNVALRMKERIKVGAAGVTQAVVDTIHEKWSLDEVVKLKFEGPSTLNMKRIHDILESKTGGLVIWRSGSSVVLYRGLAYKLGCVQTYVKEKGVNSDISLQPKKSVRLPKNLSEEQLMEMSEFNDVLDELGPRYVDWSGCPPLPVDADLLPPVVPGYKTPFRLLPYGVRKSLADKETTHYRRLARSMPPHFALGRNRELQGLAAAMVKLWRKSAIAKIAIKRGVLNTSNERMAEQLKKLTGGTLLSRNKEYIVFYRGNDFLPPAVTEALKERETLTLLQYQEEDALRHSSPLLNSNSKNYKVPMVAGTLAETVAATSRWGKQPSSEDVEKMMKDSAVSKRALLVNHLQNKLAIAKGKLKKAERALEKVQECLEPEDLPTDLETITDEERLVFHKMGLSMKPYLLVGRREVFDGTIENMHLHWKFREVVKIIVKGKSFAQVKHIAISLEAESGGVLVSIDRTTKGYAIILYRGKNYQRPLKLRPRNLLTKRQALARSIELQRREGLKHHISSLLEQMELLKSELEEMKDGKEVDVKKFDGKLKGSSIPLDDNMEEDEGEEAYLQSYDSGDDDNIISDSDLK